MPEQTNITVESLAERQSVIEAIDDLFVSTDRRDWDAVKRRLAPFVLFDMTSLVGGEPARLTAEQIAGSWELGLRPIEAIHHQTGNYRVALSGDEADAFCYGTAYHYRRTKSGRNTRVFVGSYDFHLVRQDTWRIDRFKFTAKFVDGNLQLENEPA